MIFSIAVEMSEKSSFGFKNVHLCLKKDLSANDEIPLLSEIFNSHFPERIQNPPWGEQAPLEERGQAGVRSRNKNGKRCAA